MRQRSGEAKMYEAPPPERRRPADVVKGHVFFAVDLAQHAPFLPVLGRGDVEFVRPLEPAEDGQHVPAVRSACQHGVDDRVQLGQVGVPGARDDLVHLHFTRRVNADDEILPEAGEQVGSPLYDDGRPHRRVLQDCNIAHPHRLFQRRLLFVVLQIAVDPVGAHGIAGVAQKADVLGEGAVNAVVAHEVYAAQLRHDGSHRAVLRFNAPAVFGLFYGEGVLEGG